mgnify:CR=1 FL=1
MNPQDLPSISLNRYFSDSELKALFEKGTLQHFSFEGEEFVRLSQDYKKLYRGTVFYDGGILPGYPHIMRIVHLTKGLSRYLKSSRFFIEEKVDGYNVRIARIKEKTIAFTRGGFICPFTTDRIPDLIDSEFFDRYPGYVLCGEVVGPGSPYNTEFIPYIKEDVVFFVFDVIKSNGTFLLPEERVITLQDFKMEQVRRWGPFDITHLKEIKEIVLHLDKEEREGIVIKTLKNEKALKYVTLSSCLRDLKVTTHLISEIPAGFYIQRIMRALFFCHEFDIPLTDSYLMEAAKALYLRPYNALKDVAEGGEIKESFDVKVRKRETAMKLLQHLNRSGIHTQLISIERVEDYYKLRFNRIYRKGTRQIRQLLKGKGFFD